MNKNLRLKIFPNSSDTSDILNAKLNTSPTGLKT